jgi:hypothetical protein
MLLQAFEVPVALFLFVEHNGFVTGALRTRSH